jgi:hypothetical protein
VKSPFRRKPAARHVRSRTSNKALLRYPNALDRSKLIPELTERGTFLADIPDDKTMLAQADLAEKALLQTPNGRYGTASITAAAAIFGKGRQDRDAIPPPSAVRLWQQEAWGFYDLVGEAGYTADFYGNCFSRIDLVPGIENAEGAVATTFDDEAPEAPVLTQVSDLIKALRPSHGGITGFNATAGTNLALAGEGFMYLNDEKDANPGTWEFLSTDELRPISGGGGSTSKVTWVRYYGPGFYPRRLDDKSYIVRVWVPHPRFSRHAQSSFKRLLPILDELVLLTREVRGETVSRLINNGLICVPEELNFDIDTDEEGDQSEPGSEESDPFTRDFIDWAMKPITDKDSAAGVVPMSVVGPAEYIDKIKYVSFARPDAAIAMAKRREAVERFAQGIDLPPEIVLGHFNCCDQDTEILTERGWLRHDALCIGDEVLTLNHGTGLSEWQAVERVSSFAVSNHPMVALGHQSHDSLSTVDHRWPILTDAGERRWRPSEDLNTNCCLIPGAPNADAPSEPKWSDAFVELVAWYWTEGTDHASGGATIYQSQAANPEHVASIRRSLQALAGPASASLHRSSRGFGHAKCSFPDCGWPVHGQGLCNAHRYQARSGLPLRAVRRSSEHPGFTDQTGLAWRETPVDKRGMVRFYLNKLLADQIRSVAPEKVIQIGWLRSLTAAQVELFVQRSVDGDGCRVSAGALQLHQTDKRRSEVFGIACLLSGRAVTERVSHTSGGFADVDRFQVLTRAPKPMHITNPDVPGVHKRLISYTGTIWCPTVPNGTWMARRHGKTYFTGNTTFANAGVITEDLFRTHIEPKLLVWVEALTVGYLWPAMMEAAGLGVNEETGEMPEIPPEIRKCRVWYDASRLVAHTDRSKNASEAHASMTLSDESYLRSLGFTTDDLPGPDEVAMRVRLAQALNVRETIRAQDANVMPFYDPNLLRPEVQPGFPEEGVTLPDPGLAKKLEAQKEALGVTPAPGTRGGPALPSPLGTPAGTPGGTPGAPPGAAPPPAAVTASAHYRQFIGVEPYGIGVLALRISAGSEVAIERAVERAANRLRGEARRIPTFAMVLDGIPPAEIARTLGPKVVEEIGVDRLFAGEFAALARNVAAWAREHGSASPGTLAQRVTATAQEMAKRRLFDPDFVVDVAYFAQHVEEVGWIRSSNRWSTGQPELTAGQS